MRKTLLKIQALLDDIRGDAKLLNIAPLTRKIEQVSQLFEGIVHEFKSEKKDDK